MLRLFATRAASAALRQPQQTSAAKASFAWTQRQRVAGYCDAGAGKEEEEKAKVVIFLEGVGIDAKYQEKIKDLETLLYDIKTEHLKKEGMPVKERKKLLAHIEKYKRGLWAPRKLKMW